MWCRTPGSSAEAEGSGGSESGAFRGVSRGVFRRHALVLGGAARGRRRSYFRFISI